MTIRNRTNIPAIVSATEYVRNSTASFEPYFIDHEYWCIFFTSGEDLNSIIDKVIPSDILVEICHGNLHLLLNNSTEGRSDTLPHVLSLADRLSIPKNKITLVTGSYDANDSDIQCVVSDIFELSQTLKLTRREMPDTTIKKRFIYPNHRWQLHRPILVSLLAIKDLIKYGHVSMRQADDNRSWNSIYPKMITQMPMLSSHESTIMSIPDLYIDEVEFNVGYPNELKKQYYKESYFSVVSETNYYKGTHRFFSEKTYKAIDYEVPFILVSRPKSLSLLRTKGYKTFHPYINEEYDLEEDDNIRMTMISDEIERLCHLTDDELVEMSSQLSAICAYNREVLERKRYPRDFIRRSTDAL